MLTVSPTRTSSCSTICSLWSEARETTVPASCTGSSTATGVNVPVRPTKTSIASTRVVPRSALNL
jgi:hypothetical protein